MAIQHVIGFDDAPFARERRGDVPIVGAVFCGPRLEGVLLGRVRRDGANATAVLRDLVGGSRFAAHLQLVFLQGISLAGFNVVDIQALWQALGIPVVTVARRSPDLGAIEAALRTRVPGGARKLRVLRRAGPMEPLAGVWVQRAGIEAREVERVIRRFALNGNIPEPLRAAHLIAGALVTGQSTGRV
ncbi:MAG TPA: DUF99 family protein [Longimicrobiales bacterium]